MARFLLLLGASLVLTACGQPQVPEPAAEPVAEAGPPATLLGGPPAAEPEPSPVPAAAGTARRPGWGAMAPIPNPPEYAAGDPPYRLIGPRLDAPVQRAAGPPGARTQVRARAAAGPRPARVRHVIWPGQRPSAGTLGPNPG